MKVSNEVIEKLHASDADIDDIIYEFLQEHGEEIFTDRLSSLFCTSGGYADEEGDMDFTLISATSDGTLIKVLATTYFDEKFYGGGCPDMPTRRPRQGDFEFFIELSTGNILLEPPPKLTHPGLEF